ncbi:MAG TPA: glycosyltransferase family 2 protein [Lysobacter sp.]
MDRQPLAKTKIAVVVPCYNEEVAIGQVVTDFRQALPGAEIHVFDNNSSDRTSEIAAEHGAIVHFVELRGKGNVVRRIFADVDADFYVMIDGDATYDAPSAPALLALAREKGLDMVVGCRKHEDAAAYRAGHQFGNRMLTTTVLRLFGGKFTDMLSGYRVFSRRFAKSFPAMAKGFETETELTVHALELRMPYGEMITPYYARPEGSTSKLSTYRDGWRILKTIGKLFVLERPLHMAWAFAGALLLGSIILAVPLLQTYLQTGLVPRLPTALLSTGMVLLAAVISVAGVVLHATTVARREVKRLAYLALPPPGA